MSARVVIPSGLAVIVLAAAVVASSSANTPAAPSQVTERPRGIVMDCSTQSGLGGAPGSTFTSPRNLVVGPLSMLGAGGTPEYVEAVGGQKFPLVMRGGHRVTIEVSRRSGQGVRLSYGQKPASRVRTFISCRRGQFSPGSGRPAGRFSFWSGAVLAPSPRCVHLLVWVDDAPSPRRAVIRLGVNDCA